MTSLALALADKDRFSVNWIVSKKADLIFFIGGALTAYLMFYLHAGLSLDMVTVWFIWVVFLDTPHFFGTYMRTYFDKEEFAARKSLLLGSLAWLLVGPAMIGLSYLMYSTGMGRYNIPFYLYIVLFNFWAYWHVVRQHFGIMSLYKKKNDDFGPIDTRIDKYLLYGGLLAPFAAFIVRHPEARMVMSIDGTFPAYPAAAGSVFSISYLSQLSWEHGVVLATVIFMAGVSIAFISRQIYRWRQGMALNIPKILFFIALIPLYAFICYSPAILTAPLISFSIFVTIYHDVQYHAIVWFYSRNRYHKPGVDQKKFGFATKLSKSIFTYAAAAIAMGVILRVFGCTFEIHPGCGPLVITSQNFLFGDISTKELLYSIVIGIPLHHYFVDQYIWRPSKDKTLQKDLKLAKEQTG